MKWLPWRRAGSAARSGPWREIRVTLLEAAVVVFVLAQRGVGFMVIFMVLGLLVWIPYSFFVIARKPEQRRWRLACIGIWVLAVPLVYGVHSYRHETTRRNADEMVAAIEAFHRASGRYPATLDEIGIDREQVKDRLGSMAGYFVQNGKPHLGYPDTFTPFGYCRYGFDKHAWRCIVD